MLRVDRNGAAAPGNNTPSGGDPRIYTYGHRNVQGIDFRPVGTVNAGQAYTGEHGPNHSDEVTPLVAGGNAGWDPQNRPTLTCADGYCGYAGNPTTMPMSDTTRFPTAIRPAWVHNTGERGMGPVAFMNGAQWKAWNGRLAVSIMGAKTLHVVELNAAEPARRDDCIGPSGQPHALVGAGPGRQSVCRGRRRRNLASDAELIRLPAYVERRTPDCSKAGHPDCETGAYRMSQRFAFRSHPPHLPDTRML